MSYGRNFGFLVTPTGGQRAGRFYNDEGAAVPIGAPVIVKVGTNDLGLQAVELATGAQAKPLPGQGGIAVYEHTNFDGYDSVITTYSDLDTVPKGAACQVISGSEVKVVLKNTTATSFLGRADYPAARVMVAGLGATPTVSVGDMLTPGTGDDTDGYWAKTTDSDQAWLVVTKVDDLGTAVEARINF